MLTNTNRGGIRESLKQWSQRKNIPDDVLNDFIEIALSKANRSLRIPPLEGINFPVVSDSGYFELPTDFLEMKELLVQVNGRNIILERKAIHEVDYAATQYGVNPCIFGRVGTSIRVAPWTLGDDVNLLMYYWKIIPAMPDDSVTNWFTTYSPETLLYGALAELSEYTRDPEGSAMWAEKFNNSINTLQAVEDRSEWGGSTIAVTLTGST